MVRRDAGGIVRGLIGTDSGTAFGSTNRLVVGKKPTAVLVTEQHVEQGIDQGVEQRPGTESAVRAGETQLSMQRVP
jgi:hypothetical protein